MSSLTEKRYFIAVLPPHNLIEEVEAIKDDFALNYQSKRSKNAPAHITLHMPFLWKQDKEEKLSQELKECGFEIYKSEHRTRFIYFSAIKKII